MLLRRNESKTAVKLSIDVCIEIIRRQTDKFCEQLDMDYPRVVNHNDDMNNLIKVSHVIYTFGVGLFGGLLYAFQQGVIPTLLTLTPQEYTKVEQGLIVNLDAFPTGVIVIASISMLLPLFPLIALRKHWRTSFWRLTFVGWILFFFGVSLFTILLNVPINEYVKTWSAAAPPADWQSARDNWNRLNVIRTPINYVALICFILAGMRMHQLEDR
jgi:uncharacterized membrane protein